MMRLIACGLFAAALFPGLAGAGELDRESVPAPAGTAKTEPAVAAGGSEMDGESPAQSHFWRRGWYGGPYWWGGYAHVGLAWGWAGYSTPWAWGYSYPAFYAYRGWYGGFYPAYWGWGGWGYRGWW